MDTTGRPRKSLIDVMRTKAWLAEMMFATKSKNLNQFGKILNSNIKKMLYDYASGTHSIAEKHLRQIDEKVNQHLGVIHKQDIENGKKRNSIFIPINGKSVFTVGPPNDEDGAYIPLWDALNGTMEEVQQVMFRFDPAIQLQKYLGLPFKIKIQAITAKVFNEIDPPNYWDDKSSMNVVAEAYANGEIVVDLPLVTAVIATWRYSHFIGDCIPMLDYIMIGLFEKAIPDLSNFYNITDDLLECIYELDMQNVNELEAAIKDLNYDTPFGLIRIETAEEITEQFSGEALLDNESNKDRPLGKYFLKNQPKFDVVYEDYQTAPYDIWHKAFEGLRVSDYLRPEVDKIKIRKEAEERARVKANMEKMKKAELKAKAKSEKVAPLNTLFKLGSKKGSF